MRSTSGTTVNPKTLEGWGSRPYDWQFAVSLQQELMPRVSGTLSYNRRWWGNFYYTDNRAVGPNDYDQVTMVGHSNGGDIAVFYAAGHPDTVKKVVTLDNIRVKRSKPGLMRQHLTCVRAAASCVA